MRACFIVEEPSNVALRALNYSPYVEAFRKSRRARNNFTIQDVLAEDGLAYGYSFPRRDCDPQYGIELLSQSDMFASEPAGRWIKADHSIRAEKHKTEKWDILTAGVGTLGETELYGRSIIVDSRLTGRYVGDQLLLRFSEPGGIDNLYLYAFFCTSIGVAILRSTSYGTKQLRFRVNLLNNLRIPEPETAVKKRIANLIATSVLEREIYNREIIAARNVIEDLPLVREALLQCGNRGKRAIAWSGGLPTLDARNYAFTGTALQDLRRSWKIRLKDITPQNGIFDGPRFARIPCRPPNGVELMSQRDVFMIRRIPRRIVAPRIQREFLYCHANTLLLASDGQVTEGSLFGRVELAANGLTAAAISEHITRVVPDNTLVASAYAYLSSRVGLRLLQSTAVGTSVPTMRLDLVRELPFPDLAEPQITTITGHINKAVRARNVADRAEAEAVSIIEQEVLPAWLS